MEKALLNTTECNLAVFFKITKAKLFTLVILLLEIYPTNILAYVPINYVLQRYYNSKKQETIEVFINRLINRGISIQWSAMHL